MSGRTVFLARAMSLAFGVVAAFVIMEQVARADDEQNQGCCDASTACTGCQPCGDGLYADVGTNAWTKCKFKSGPAEARCYDAIPGDISGVPTGYCKYDSGKRWTDAACTNKAANGSIIVGPAFCKVPDSTPCKKEIE